MRFNQLFAIALIGSAALGACSHAHAADHGDPSLAAQAAISFDRARDIALIARPGELKDWELERERGGSGLRYSFDITSGATTFEVGVDARDGTVLENAVADSD